MTEGQKTGPEDRRPHFGVVAVAVPGMAPRVVEREIIVARIVPTQVGFTGDTVVRPAVSGIRR